MPHARCLDPRTRELLWTALAIRCVCARRDADPDASLVARLTCFELLDLHGFGWARVREVRAWLAAQGFELREGAAPLVFPRGCSMAGA